MRCLHLCELPHNWRSSPTTFSGAKLWPLGIKIMCFITNFDKDSEGFYLQLLPDLQTLSKLLLCHPLPSRIGNVLLSDVSTLNPYNSWVESCICLSSNNYIPCVAGDVIFLKPVKIFQG